ncbi:MAG: coenzyme F420-0:L-glutamate ligase [Patescibacteria group bacterium]|nr:coenzyme F420-0:L-glutamate ligase [Patescibacteria group bacterium]
MPDIVLIDDQPMAVQESKPNPGKSLDIEVGGETYARLPIRTRVINEKDDLLGLVGEYVIPQAKPGDILAVSEKVVALTQGRIMRIDSIKPRRLARFLSKRVRNNYGTKDFKGFGHGTAMGMELLIREAGYPRALFAAAVSALTRPLGIKGAFYLICGKRSKSVDCPMSFAIHPYTMYAKLAPMDPEGVAAKLSRATGCETIIVDANYQGVFSLGKSTRRITERLIKGLLRDNPMGQDDELTPFCLIRKKGKG